LGDIEARLCDLELSLGVADDGSVFSKIFDVNNEIGRAVRQQPALRQALLELQSNINVITVSLKAGDASRARDALRASLLSFRKLQEARASPKKNL
jgi:hypothetical protein